MACLEMRSGSRWWYGRLVAGGKVYVKNLGVEITGRRPASIGEEGDRRFEQSRASAKAKLDELVAQSRGRRHSAELVQMLHEIQTGSRIGTVPVGELYARWRQIPRRRSGDLSHAYTVWAKSVFARFQAFLQARYPAVSEMAQVTPAMAAQFMAREQGRRVSGRTYNGELSLLKGAFQRLRREAGLGENPFDGIVSKEEGTLHRQPFSPEELRAILDAARADEFCRPLAVTGMCTAMRLGDVCLLKWSDVDLDKGFISVKTSKTGERVWIPMFPLLHEELAAKPRKGEFCFAEQAATYQRNPSAVHKRLKAVFRAAGFADPVEATPTPKRRPAKPPAPPVEELRRRWAAVDVEGTWRTQKVRETAGKVFDLYTSGRTTGQIARELGITKGGVANYFRRIETALGCRIVRSRSRPAPAAPTAARAPMHATREKGMRRVSVRGFHAFRASWVTLALSSGVPIELVRRVTGHTTTQIVLDNYFQPGREQFRQALLAAMPKLLTEGGQSREEQMREILKHMRARTWKRDRARLLELMNVTYPNEEPGRGESGGR